MWKGLSSHGSVVIATMLIQPFAIHWWLSWNFKPFASDFLLLLKTIYWVLQPLWCRWNPRSNCLNKRICILNLSIPLRNHVIKMMIFNLLFHILLCIYEERIINLQIIRYLNYFTISNSWHRCNLPQANYIYAMNSNIEFNFVQKQTPHTYNSISTI